MAACLTLLRSALLAVATVLVALASAAYMMAVPAPALDTLAMLAPPAHTTGVASP